ncbi:ceramide kinase-like [Durio zibethinus]|uniref:Ceramide kinase-like n=1 Tax=Durio zibethinus TaxID=66656 RepID=A0A6P5Y9V0_DURZI|nr:ceramide kinase-like [Durio zibethinus]
MEINGGACNSEDKRRNAQVEGEASVLSSNVLLDHVGEVTLTLHSDGLSWKSLDSFDNGASTCLGIKFVPEIATEFKLSDIYAVELTDSDMIQESNLTCAGECFLGNDSDYSEMNHFAVHSFQKSKSQPCLWILAMYTFGHKDLQTCQMWVNKINDSLNKEVGRPKNLLVFVHPMSGKANGWRTWETVAPIFSRAKINAKVIVTQKAGHAFDVMTSISNDELNLYDGAVAVGGDGFFNEILNGYLSSRHKAPFPPAPSDFLDALGNDVNSLVHCQKKAGFETHHNKESDPFLPSLEHNESQFSHLGTNDGSHSVDKEIEYSLPNRKFRFGIIPAGSTDAIVICTTGIRDPITSALHIVLGKRVCLDVAQVVRWKTTSTSKVEPYVRYAASFAGYGFYGDVITESEKYRWMGPKRYDYAGTKVFLRHRSYEAEVAYLEVGSETISSIPDGSRLFGKVWSLKRKKSERIICRANCNVCNKKPVCSSTRSPPATPYMISQETRWLKSKGRFLSVGAAIMSNRNERAPDGLVADAHLSDGFLHLLLIRDCPHALYLWHLTQLAMKGGNPLNFDFVEHYKTPAFTFTSFGNESVWNLDGELFQAHKFSAQVFRGLVCLFASGPEV